MVATFNSCDMSVATLPVPKSNTATTPPAAKRSLFKRGISGGEESLRKLREMAKRHAELSQEAGALLAECKKIEAEAVAAERDFIQNPTIAGLRKLVALRPQGREAIEIFGDLHRRISLGGMVATKFLAEHKKDLRSTLLAVATYRADAARNKFDAELARARTTLGKEGFDEEGLRAAPKVRSAQRRAEQFERLVESIKSDKDENLWAHSGQLLSEE